MGHDVHSARASWVSYVARSGTFLRPLKVLLARFLALPPSTPALSHFVFVSIFLHSARFLFSLPPFSSLICGGTALAHVDTAISWSVLYNFSSLPFFVGGFLL